MAKDSAFPVDQSIMIIDQRINQIEYLINFYIYLNYQTLIVVFIRIIKTFDISSPKIFQQKYCLLKFHLLSWFNEINVFFFTVIAALVVKGPPNMQKNMDQILMIKWLFCIVNMREQIITTQIIKISSLLYIYSDLNFQQGGQSNCFDFDDKNFMQAKYSQSLQQNHCKIFQSQNQAQILTFQPLIDIEQCHSLLQLMQKPSTAKSLKENSDSKYSEIQNDSDSFDEESSHQIFHPKRYRYKKDHALSLRQGEPSVNANKFKNSLWKIEQNVAYMNFLRQYQDVMEGNRLDRRILKINLMMSQTVKSRSAHQCGSHHQKMMKHHHDIPSIIKYIQTLMEEKNVRTVDTDLEPLPITQDPYSVQLVQIVDLIQLQKSYFSQNISEFIINSYKADYQWEY